MRPAYILANRSPVGMWRVTSLHLFCALLITVLVGCEGLAGEPEIVATIPPATAAPSTVSESGVPPQSPDLAAGARIYAENCTRCHGINGAGDGELALNGQVQNPGNFTDPATSRYQTPREWFNTITNGRLEQLMPPWRDALSEQERWDVALYTYTLHYQPEQIAQGQATSAGIVPDTNPQTLAQITDAGLFEQIAARSADLSDDQIWNIVAYTRTTALQNADIIGQAIVAQPQTTEEPVPPLPPTSSVEGVTGTVTGTISNGTEGGTVPPALEITLFATDGQSQPQRYETVADANGAFSVSDVLLSPQLSYIAVTAYLERTYTSQFVPAEGGSLDLPITLYEITSDPTVLTINGIVSQITAVGDGLQVVQVLNVRNNSDRMFTTNDPVGDGQFASLVIPLPAGGAIIGFPGNEQRYIVAEDQSTVIDTAPVLPNAEHIVQMVFFLPYTDGAIIEQPLNYAVEGAVRLLLRPETVTAASEQLEPLGPQLVGDTTYSGYGATLSLQPGEAVTFELQGTGATTVAEIEAPRVSSNNLVVVIIVVLIGQALFIGGLYTFYRRRKSREQPGANPQNTPRLIDALAQQIAELDEAHERGDINHDVYQRRRQQLKARLAELMDDTGDQA